MSTAKKKSLRSIEGRATASWVLAGFIVLVAISLFLELAGDVWLNEGFAWDVPIMLAIHRLSQPWLDTLFTSITHTAGSLIELPLAGTAIYLWLRKEQKTALLIILSVATATGTNALLKSLFARPRPEVFPPLVVEHSFSFPSGHTMSAVAFYGLVAILLWRRKQYGWALLAGLWVLLVTVSRVYLGVHYPSDVRASLALGAIWLVGATSILRRFPDTG